ncbi:hypothetical protein, partial [Gemmatimonas sp.]|uniref:ATP-binding protein n=1 Tax=Gemmatimonas sp. TaxID=1962908 RepID=UPI003568ABB1
MKRTDALLLQKVRVGRTPGIDEPFTIDGLCPGINLIHGPNASGKSSTARAIEAVLWPSASAASRLIVSAQYQLGSSTFVVDLDSGDVRVQQDGIKSLPPVLPAPELRKRYQLSLHELLAATDQAEGFADEIARQSAGGYDFAAASKALGYQAKPSTVRPEVQAHTDAKVLLTAAQKQQAMLHDEASQLEVLKDASEAAQRANEQERVLGKACKHANADVSANDARSALAVFPPVLAHITHDVLSEYNTLDKRRVEAVEVERAESQREEEALQLAAVALPDGPIQPETIEVLRNRAQLLSTAEFRVQTAKLRLADLSQQVTAARQAIGSATSDEQLVRLNGDSFDDLAGFAYDADKLSADYLAADSEARIASEGAAATTLVNLDAASAGVHALALWLKEPALHVESAGVIRRVALVWLIASVAVVASVILAIVWQPVSALGAPTALVLLWAVLQKVPSETGAQEIRQKDYLSLGLATPRSWTTDHVVDTLDGLHRLIAEGRVATRFSQWATEAGKRRLALEPRRAALELRKQKLEVQIGVTPGGDSQRLAWLGDHITRWRDSFRLKSGASAELNMALVQLESAKNAIAESTAQTDNAIAATSAGATALANGLAERQNRYEARTNEAKDARTRVAKAAVRREQLEAEIAKLFDSCGCPDGDVDALRSLNSMRFEYADAEVRLRSADQVVTSALNELQSDALFNPSLASASADDLKGRRADAGRQASNYEQALTDYKDLESRINLAKQQLDVERRLADLAAKEDALKMFRTRDLCALIGEALVRNVQRETRDQQRPKVFHRARKLFSSITRGRYRLDFEDTEGKGAPKFRAFDTRTSRGHALEELSSATRVQLLMAVRVAFVETQENGVCLP